MARENILTPLRALLAWSVVASHFPQSAPWKPGVLSANVPAFLAISGFCIYLSLQKHGLKNWIQRRASRLMPGLITATLLAVGIGATLTTATQLGYWGSEQTWKFVGAQISTLGFLQQSPEGVAIPRLNQPTHTLKYEIVCYVALCFGIWRSRQNKESLTAVTLIVAASLFLILSWISMPGLEPLQELKHGLQLCFFFTCGTIAAAYKDTWLKKKWIPLHIICGAILMQMFAEPGGKWESWENAPISLGIILFFIMGSHCVPEPKWFKKVGDPSYGIYLYHFPIGCAIAHHLKLESNALFFATLITSTIAGLASYHFIEKRFHRIQTHEQTKQKPIPEKPGDGD